MLIIMEEACMLHINYFNKHNTESFLIGKIPYYYDTTIKVSIVFAA